MGANEWIALVACGLTGLATVGSVAFFHGRTSSQIADVREDVADIKRKVYNGLSDTVADIATRVAVIESRVPQGAAE